MTILGTLYIISAPSGAGKTSLVRKLLDCTPGLEVSVSHTTRPARANERDGVDYHFVDPTTFAALVQQGLFLEHAKVFDHDYGTSRYAVLERLRAGSDVILEIDWQGARQVRARLPRTQSIFILPPSRAALRERLQNRGQDSAAVIEQRLQEAARDLSHFAEFDYLVINDEFTAALEALRAIFIANRQRRETQLARQRLLFQGLLS
jgi:guanylate kinase